MSRALAILLSFTVSVGVVVYASTSAPEPLLKVGQTYAFVLHCDAYSACYGEVHKIVEIRPDGWLSTLQCADPDCRKTEPWLVNLSRVVAVKAAKVGRAAD